jgi:hypothetical protein
MRIPVLALTSVFAFGLLSAPLLLQEKGGEEETGPYSVVENWPVPWAQQGYIWGSQPGVFAETSNRIFIAARGELKLPDTLPRGFNGIWGSLNQRATEPKAEMRNCLRWWTATAKSSTVNGNSGTSCWKAAAVRTRSASVHDPSATSGSNDAARDLRVHQPRNAAANARRLTPGDDGTHFNRPQDNARLSEVRW